MCCSSNENDNFKNPYDYNELVGYVKDAAWDYEKEVRLRVDMPNENNYKAIAVEIPLDILKQIKIMRGPWYEDESILEQVPSEYKLNIVESSKFVEKIPRNICDKCKYMQK